MSRSNLHSILYVEDDVDIQAVAEIALTSVGGFELCACTSGAEALLKVKTFTPDLLLLDVMMPGMDGRTTLAQLRKLPSCAQTPVIFMTAKLQHEDLVDYYALGAIGVLAKPFDPMSLAQQVRQIWDRKQ